MFSKPISGLGMEKQNLHNKNTHSLIKTNALQHKTRMWANAQPDGHPAEHRRRPLFTAAKFS